LKRDVQIGVARRHDLIRAKLSGTSEVPHQYSERETTRRRDAVIKRMLNTPPKPHSEMKMGKPRSKPSKSPKRLADVAMKKQSKD
jgi:hypothetical protein